MSSGVGTVLTDRSAVCYLRDRLYAISRATGPSLASQCVNSTTNFLTGIMIARLCSKEQFGLYALSLSIVIFFNDFQNALITTPYMIYGPRLHGNDKRQYSGSALIQQFAFSLLAALLLLISSAIASLGFGPSGLPDVLRVLAVFIVFMMLRDFARQFCFATLKVKAALVLDACVALVQIGCLVSLFLYGSLSASRAFIAIGIACSVTSIGWLILNRALFLPKLVKVMPDFSRNWKPARWIIGSYVLWALAMNLYPWLISAFHGIEANATWGVCGGAVAFGNVILMGIQNVVGPRILHSFAKGGVLGMREFVFRSTRLFILVMAGVCLLYMVFSNAVVVVLYGAKYAGNGSIVFVLALNLLVASASFSLGRGLFAMERADVECSVNAATTVALFAFGIWLVRSAGPLGAAWALLITSALSCLFRVFAFKRIAT